MRVARRLIGLGLGLGLAARPVTGGDLRDLYFGEALCHAYQGQFFDAIQRLDTELAMYHGLDEPGLDTLHFHINDAEFTDRDFRLNYPIHHSPRRPLKAVFERAAPTSAPNVSAVRHSRIPV